MPYPKQMRTGQKRTMERPTNASIRKGGGRIKNEKFLLPTNPVGEKSPATNRGLRNSPRFWKNGEHSPVARGKKQKWEPWPTEAKRKGGKVNTLPQSYFYRVQGRGLKYSKKKKKKTDLMKGGTHQTPGH